MSNDDMPDAEQLRDIFGVLTESVPKLLDSVTKVLYGAQEGTKFGESVAAFYKALKDAGMSNEQAFELTKDYMSNLSLGGMLKNVVSGASKHED
ncbi:MAG: hypothetical protein A4E29_01743 [Methanomassiliicoccales archaeon PtaB.Bin134]|jgi:hypothetical protein|nr:MAG: hypothetical protein A4E29_01743 [Methanomassiliicoccales archaeon PtaB.Bin134]